FGFVIGPAVGGYLGNFHSRAPFWVAAGLSLLNSLYGFFVLPESLPPERRAKSAWHMANPLRSLTLLRSHAQLAGLSVVVTLYYLAHTSLPSMWALYTMKRYDWSKGDVGLSLAVVGVCASLISGVLVGPFVKRFGVRRSVLFALLCGFLSRRHTVALEFAAGGLCDTARRGNRTARRTTGSFFRSIGLSRHGASPSRRQMQFAYSLPMLACSGKPLKCITITGDNLNN